MSIILTYTNALLCFGAGHFQQRTNAVRIHGGVHFRKFARDQHAIGSFTTSTTILGAIKDGLFDGGGRSSYREVLANIPIVRHLIQARIFGHF
jgi:hypothetical protein